MDKILDSEFRNNLYKGLIDAGYDKKEAQKIVGVKYHASLKTDLIGKINQFAADTEADKYVDEETTANVLRELSAGMAELKSSKI